MHTIISPPYVHILVSIGAPLEISQASGLITKVNGEGDSVAAATSTAVVSSASGTPSLSTQALSSSRHHTFAAGDNVRVELEVEIFKMMQEGHGDWDDQLLEVRHQHCIYIYIYIYIHIYIHVQVNLRVLV